MREEILRLLQATPFRPFAVIMDSGQRVVVRHRENVAFDPVEKTANCYALSDGLMYILPWDRISSAVLVDHGELLPASSRQNGD